MYGTRTSPVLVETNVGKAVLKLPAGCGSPDRLICEFIGTSLAKWLGVPTPDFALFRTGHDYVTLMQGIDEDLAKEEDGFISRYEKTFPFTPLSVQDIKNKGVLTKLVFLDTWIRNKDRYYKNTDESSTRNTTNIFLVENGQAKEPYFLKVIDHTEAFIGDSLGLELENHFGPAAICDPAIFGRFPEFDHYIDRNTAYRVADRLSGIKSPTVRAIFNRIPESWPLDAQLKKKFISFIVKRAAFVATTLPQVLFPNRTTLFY